MLPRGEGCNTLLHEGLANIKTGKECYIVIVIYLQQTKLSDLAFSKKKKKMKFVRFVIYLQQTKLSDLAFSKKRKKMKFVRKLYR